MKFRTLLVLAFFLGITALLNAQTYLQQDFSSSTVVSDYVSATPNNGQWNGISSSGGSATWSINTGKLRLVRTGNAGAFTRSTDFSPTPSHLLVKFDLTVSGNSSAVTSAASWQIGSGFSATLNSAETNANTHSRFGLNLTATNGTFTLRNLVASTNSGNLSGTQTISWYINNSGATITYIGPNGSTVTVANDMIDVWAGTTLIFDDAAAQTTTQTLTDFKFSMANGSATIDMDNFMITPIPQASITVNPTSLSAFSTTQGTPSAEQSYTISGSNLSPASGNITVNALSGYEYSLTSGGPFTSTLSVPYTAGGTFANNTVYVRLTGASPGTFNGNISNSGGGATAQDVAVTGSVTTLSPFLSATPTSLSGFTTITGTASTAQTYNLSGTNLTPSAGNITVNAPTNYEVSNNNSSWGSSTTAAYTAGGTFTNPTVYVRIAASAPAGSPSGNVNNSGGGATAVDVAVSGTVNPVPVLTATPTSLSGFSTITGTASAAQTFNLSSTTLLPASGTITVTAPTDYEVSLNGSTYFASVNAAYTSGGTFANPTVYVRIKASAPVGSPSGNITMSGGTVSTPPTVALSGTVAPQPSIVVNPTSLTGFVTPQGTPSAEQSYTLTGSNLNPASGNLSVAAVSGFEYSLTSGGTFTTTLTIPYTGGAISTTVYVRLIGAVANSYSGNAVNSGGGATSQNVALSGTVNPGPPFVVINKVYNDGVSASGDEIELLVINNNADLRGLIFKDHSSNGGSDGGGTFLLSNNAAWNNIPAGTLIRITGASTAPDVNPSDFTMTVGRANTTYFTNTIGAFDISQNEIVMLKAAGSGTGLNNGSTGAIHTFALGSANSNSIYTNAPGYRINTNAAAIGTGQYAIANNTTSTLNDFNGGATGASISTTETFLTPNNNTNAIYICSLRNGGTTQPTAAATSMTFTGVGPNDITVNWVNPVSGGGARRIVVARLQATAAVAPTDGQAYTANAVFGSGSTTGTNNFVVYDGTGTSVAVSGLASGTVYSFDVYEYNGTDFCTNYFGTPLTGNRNTTSATTVQFVSATATVSEGVGTYNVVLSITNPSASVATTGQINFLSTDPLTTGQAADINNFNIGTFTFPANSSANQTVTITVTDDALTESTEDFVFDLQNVAGGVNAQEGTINSFLLSITDNDAAGTIIYSTASGNATTDAIWSYNTGGPGQTITSLVPGGFSATAGKDFVIQAGHTVSCPSGTIYNMNNLTVQATAKLWAGQTAINVFVNLFGNATVDGAFGNNLTAADALGINFAGTNCTLSGNGVVNASRFKKPIVTDLPASNPTVTPTTAANINMNANLWFSGTCIMNEGANGSNFNLTIAAGKTVTVQSTNGNVAIDGTLGTGSGNNGGTYTINGTLTINGILYAKNDNTAGTVAFVISNTGTINAKTVNADLNNGSIPTTFTIAANGKLNVTGALNLISGTLNSAGNVYIKSTATSQAYIDNFSSGYSGSVSGNVKVERYITSLNTGFRYIGAPVSTTAGGPTLNLSAISGFVISGVPGQVIPLGTCNASTNPPNVAPNSPYGTFMYWVESSIVNQCRQSGWWFQTAGTMTIGRGYGAKLSGGSTVTYTGEANTGTKTFNGCTRTNIFNNNFDGWNLVSNPFPSSIRIDDTDNGTNNANNMPTGFNGTIQFYITSGPFTGSYQPANSGSSPVNIALGQGFWVQVASYGATPAWTLTNAHRTTNSATYYNDNSPVKHHLKIDVAGNGFMDKTDINFIDAAQTGFDFYDGTKWDSRAEQPTLYTLIGADQASINSLPSLTEVVSIPMGVKPGTSGNFTFTFDDVASFPQSAMLYLEDLKENTMTDIRANNTYAFMANVSDNPDRFMLHFKPGVQVEVADQDCDNAGSIEVVQPSSTVWSSYNLKDNNGVIYAQGTNFSGSITVNGLQPQEYILTLTHPSGYVAQEFITVNGSPVVTADFIVSASNVQVDEPVSFTATTTNANQLVWNFGDGTIVTGNGAIQHTYDANGTYNVTLTAQNDVCNDVVQKVITVGTTTGIDNDAANGLKIYGQGDRLIIELANMATGIANLTMYNMLGQKVESFTGISTINGRSEITLKNVKPGHYSVQVVAGNQVFNQKVYLSAN